jgi:hypothetical protein
LIYGRSASREEDPLTVAEHADEGGWLDASGSALRQQVLVLYLSNSSLDSEVLAWAIYDGTGEASSETGDHPVRPFATGLAALRAGWRLLGASQLIPAAPGAEYATSFQKFEFFFERMVEMAGGTGGQRL